MSLVIDIDRNVELKADNLFGSYGMNTAEAMKFFVYTAVKTNSVPFAFNNEFVPRQQSMSDAIKDTENNENLYGPFDTTDEMFDALLED
jgi:addiction module RelB/DinJ family antitoxin